MATFGCHHDGGEGYDQERALFTRSLLILTKHMVMLPFVRFLRVHSDTLTAAVRASRL
jgi:hypothetical protein